MVSVPGKARSISLAGCRLEIRRAKRDALRYREEAMAAQRLLKTQDHVLNDLLHRLGQKERELDALYQSTSWRFTRPMRSITKIGAKYVASTRGKTTGTPNTAATLIDTPRHDTLLFDKLARPTIFIECTHTYHSDLNTGIQRVVRNIVRFSPAVGNELGFDVVPVIAVNGRFEKADASQVLANKQLLPEIISLAAPKPSGWRRRLRAVAGAMRRGTATALPFKVVHRFLYAPPDAVGPRWFLSLPGRVRAKLRRDKAASIQSGELAARTQLSYLDQVADHSGNILLLLDSSWTTPIWPPTHRFKSAGGKVVGIIYDLIPITHAHTSVPELTKLFKEWVSIHMETSDGFVAISNSVANQIRDFAQEQSQARWSASDAPIRHFHLGSQLDFSSKNAVGSPRISQIFAPAKPTYLMVGSIEPRKMHQHVFETFDRLWSQGEDIRLVIVGRQAWKTDTLIQRMAEHPRLGTHLFVLRDASDEELEACYDKASALIIASEIEGFGLPVVEALQRGLPVLCSDIPVFKEIAGETALFFKLDDIDDLAALLRRTSDMDLNGQLPRRVVEWMDWTESTKQLFKALGTIIEYHQSGPARGTEHRLETT